jgi:hypothetical protein
MGNARFADFQNITTDGTSRIPRTGFDQWDEDGVLHIKGLMPDSLIDAYIAERTSLLGGTPKWRPGWNGPTPYLQVQSMMALATYRPLTEAMKKLIGHAEPGLHLCLTGFQSTERRYHQDSYLNPPGVNDRYIAAWIVLEDVHPDAGPFEYVAGSHRWPVITRDKVWQQMKIKGQNPDLPTWPSDSQDWVGSACEGEIGMRESRVTQFLGKRGDVLLWNAFLVHRGSAPRDRALERRALIAHYSDVGARPDMEHRKQLANGSWYFDFPHNREPESSTHKAQK